MAPGQQQPMSQASSLIVGTTNEWTWVNCANVVFQSGTYGTRGTAAPSNVPGARDYATGWTDAADDFWLFGGVGYDSAGVANGQINDLWKYEPWRKWRRPIPVAPPSPSSRA